MNTDWIKAHQFRQSNVASPLEATALINVLIGNDFDLVGPMIDQRWNRVD